MADARSSQVFSEQAGKGMGEGSNTAWQKRPAFSSGSLWAAERESSLWMCVWTSSSLKQAILLCVLCGRLKWELNSVI